jgi:hypothetical protein
LSAPNADAGEIYIYGQTKLDPKERCKAMMADFSRKN